MSNPDALFELIAPRALEPELVDWLAEQCPQEPFLVTHLHGHNIQVLGMSNREQVQGTIPLLRLTVHTGLEQARCIGPDMQRAFPRARLRWWVVTLDTLSKPADPS